MRVYVKHRSVIKRDSNTYAGSVVVEVDGGRKMTFAVCTHVNKDKNLIEVDPDKFYQFINGRWQLIEAGEEFFNLVADAFMKFYNRFRFCFNRKMQDKRGEYLTMYRDCHVSVSDDKMFHLFKLGDLLVCAEKQSLADPYKFECREVGAVNDDMKPFIPPVELHDRLVKQVKFGEKVASDRFMNRPIGFKGWGDYHQYNKSTGRHVSYSSYKRGRL